MEVAMTDEASSYPIIILPLTEDEGSGFVALAPDLKGCLADGETREAAALDIASAIAEWIDEAKRLGQAVPPPNSSRVKSDTSATFKKLKKLVAAQKHLIDLQGKQIAGQRKLIAEQTKDIELIQVEAEKDPSARPWQFSAHTAGHALHIFRGRARRVTN
jgi:antitoxin HicB